MHVVTSFAIRVGQSLFNELHLPSIKRDETLYSWCTRFHRLNLGHSPRETSLGLFGHPQAALRHDIPFALAEFGQRTNEFLGSPLHILRHRTLFGFHAKFLPLEVELAIAALFAKDDNSLGRSQLGLKKAGELNGQLMYCPDCVNSQRHEAGHTWWRLPHQLPTSFTCDEHATSLQPFPLQQYRGVAATFELPQPSDLASEHVRPHPAARCRLTALTAWGLQIFNTDGPRLTESTLRWCYRFQAKRRGLVAFDGSVRLQTLRDGFMAHYREAFPYFDTDLLGNIDGVNGGFLAYVFRKMPSRRHPFKHVLLLNFLFDCIDEFRNVLREVLQILETEGEPGCEKHLRNMQAELLWLVQAQGQSLSQSAPAVGTSVTSAARFLDKMGGVKRDRRPHVVGTEKEAMLREILTKGFSRTEIAAKAGVRRSFIKDYLAAHPDLRETWESAHRVRETKKHRLQLQTALENHPGLPIKAIRRLPHNGFQWLYNNDREWLQEILPAIWKRQ